MNVIEVEDAEKFADDTDRACDIEQKSNAESIRKTLAKIEKPPEDFDGVHCTECGDEIPAARLKTGAFRDINCQTIIEARRRNHRSHYE
jgi:RNA polymerase-binding transcription factor DksA